MVESKEFEDMKKKLNDLEERVKALDQQHAVHLTAIFEMLIAKGVVTPEECVKFLELAKMQISNLVDESEFQRIMKTLKLKDKGEDKKKDS